MKVGVTGASGFVGSSLIPLLAAHGNEVFELTRPLGQCDPGSLDAVIHLAGLAHSRGSDRSAYEAANVTTSKDAAELAIRCGAQRFLFLSTSKVYGDSSGGSTLTGDSAVDPREPYARTKLQAEELLTTALADQMDLVILRPPVIYGPGAKGNLRIIAACAARGIPLPRLRSRRSYLSLESLNGALVDLLSAPMQNSPVVSVLADRDPTVTSELFDALGEKTDRSWVTIPGSQVAEPVLSFIDRSLLKGRYAALFNDFCLDSSDIKQVLPNFLPADTLTELPKVLSAPAEPQI